MASYHPGLCTNCCRNMASGANSWCVSCFRAQEARQAGHVRENSVTFGAFLPFGAMQATVIHHQPTPVVQVGGCRSGVPIAVGMGGEVIVAHPVVNVSVQRVVQYPSLYRGF